MRELAFDPYLHANRGTPLQYGDVSYRIEGSVPDLETLAEDAELAIDCPVALGVKLSKLLREMLGLSAKRFDTMLEIGALRSMDGQNLKKARMGTRCHVLITPLRAE